MSDQEDSEFDPDEAMKELEGMKKLLQRHVGKHKNVACLREMAGHWPKVNTATQSLTEETDLKQVVTILNNAEENERKRRMSVPFAETLTDDVDLEETSEHVVTMHEELLHLFAVYDAKLQAEREQERIFTENTKQRVQEQFLKKALLKQTRQAFEEERQRRIKMMESLLDEDNEESLALAETNEKLSLVHEDLINAFKLMEKARKEKENNQQRLTEERKEVLLQDIRRRAVKQKHQRDFEIARQEKMNEYIRRQEVPSVEDGYDMTLVKVQEDLLKLFGKLKREIEVKQEETRLHQSDLKITMQEQLLHKVLSKKVDKEEAQEKARRIKESTTLTEEDEKRQKTMDKLLSVQQQLLDVMAHTELMSPKHQVHQVKIMNARNSLLQEIRSLGSSHRIPQGRYGHSLGSSHILSHGSTFRPGRRLSQIGDLKIS